MINKDSFVEYLLAQFNDEQMYIDKFKPDLWFAEVDCFIKQSYKLAIEISASNIKISTIDKEPSIDFSLYDYVFEERKDAESFIHEIVLKQEFPSKG